MLAIGEERAASPLVIRLLGPFEVYLYGYGAALPGLRFRKSHWLLAFLTLRHGVEIDRDLLAGTLWPDRTGSQALRNSLTNLRRALGPEAGRLRSPTLRTLSLDLTDAEVDVAAFDAAIARGDPVSLEQAVAFYRGPLLDGCAEEWAFPERQTREQAYLGALGDSGCPSAALYRAGLALAREPEAREGIMGCLQGLGAIARAHGQPERAARLFGAAEALRETIDVFVPEAALDWQPHVAAIRQTLGEAAFAAAWAAGRALSPEAAVGFARETVSPGE